MRTPAIVFYVSGHGLGHAAREIAVINTLASRRPDVRLVIRTSAPPWFISASAPSSVELQTVEIESGMTQADSLNVDVDQTARRAASFYEEFQKRVELEARLLDQMRAALVVSDVPPLAFAAAARAGALSVAIANFTWDWIYGSYPQFAEIAPGVLDVIREAYSRTTCALRLPLHGGFEPMAAVTRDIPLIARKARAGREATRHALNLPEDVPVVLASFGGHGLALPFDAIARANRFTLLITEQEDRDLGGTSTTSSGLRRVTGAQLRALDLEYPDLVAAADVVVSKPGYGIVSECVAQGTALLFSSRPGFIEEDVFLGEMPEILRCRLLAQEDLRAGRWGDAVDALIRQPPPPRRMNINGAEVAAETICGMVR